MRLPRVEIVAFLIQRSKDGAQKTMLFAKGLESVAYQERWPSSRKKDVVAIPCLLLDHDTRIPLELTSQAGGTHFRLVNPDIARSLLVNRSRAKGYRRLKIAWWSFMRGKPAMNQFHNFNGFKRGESFQATVLKRVSEPLRDDHLSTSNIWKVAVLSSPRLKFHAIGREPL